MIEHCQVSVAAKASEQVDVELHWFGGLVESHIISRPVKHYDLRADYPRMVERPRTWNDRGPERRGDRRTAKCGGLPPPEAGRSLQPGEMVRRL